MTPHYTFDNKIAEYDVDEAVITREPGRIILAFPGAPYKLIRLSDDWDINTHHTTDKIITRLSRGDNRIFIYAARVVHRMREAKE